MCLKDRSSFTFETQHERVHLNGVGFVILNSSIMLQISNKAVLLICLSMKNSNMNDFNQSKYAYIYSGSSNLSRL